MQIQEWTLKQRVALKKTRSYVKTHKKQLLKMWGIIAVADIFLNGIIMMCLCAITGAKMSANPIRIIGYGLFHSGSIPLYFLVVLVTCYAAFRWHLDKALDSQQLDDKDFIISDTNEYDSSHFMDDEEKQVLLKEGDIEDLDGNILGVDMVTKKPVELNPDMPITEKRNGNTFVAGGSGSRKTRSQILPTILQSIKRGESIIVLDPKGENYEETHLLAKKNGYIVRSINYLKPICSDSIAYLHLVGNDTIAAQTMAEVIMTNAGGEQAHKGDFWADGEKALLEFGILEVSMDKKIPDEEKTLGKVYDILVHKTIDEIQAMAEGLGNDHPAKKQWDIFMTTPEQTRGGILTGLATKLQLLQEPTTNAITSYDEVDLEAPGKYKCAYYLIIDPTQPTFQWLQALMFSFLFNKLLNYASTQPGRKCRVPVNFVLDEFSKAGTIAQFEPILSVTRSYGINVMMIVQGLGQLTDLYEQTGADLILGHCDTQIFLGTTEHKTNGDWWSSKEGEVTIKTVSEKKQTAGFLSGMMGADSSDSVGSGKRALETVSELITMNRDEERVFIANAHPLKLYKFDYSNHPYYAQLEKENAIRHTPAWWSRDDVRNEKWFRTAVKEVAEEGQEGSADISFEDWKKIQIQNAKSQYVNKEALARVIKKSKQQKKQNELDKKKIEQAEYELFISRNGGTVKSDKAEAENKTASFKKKKAETEGSKKTASTKQTSDSDIPSVKEAIIANAKKKADEVKEKAEKAAETVKKNAEKVTEEKFRYFKPAKKKKKKKQEEPSEKMYSSDEVTEMAKKMAEEMLRKNGISTPPVSENTSGETSDNRDSHSDIQSKANDNRIIKVSDASENNEGKDIYVDSETGEVMDNPEQIISEPEPEDMPDNAEEFGSDSNIPDDKPEGFPDDNMPEDYPPDDVPDMPDDIPSDIVDDDDDKDGLKDIPDDEEENDLNDIPDEDEDSDDVEETSFTEL